MGLDATVMCNCIQDGLKVPDEFADVFAIDGDGYPSLMIDYDGNEEKYHRFDKWVQEACPHDDMDIASERIANWYGVSLFRNELAHQNATGRLDTLLRELPNANGGCTSPEDAATMLQELRIFKETDGVKQKFVLVNEQTGDAVWEYIPQYEGKMIQSGSEGIQLGLDEAGFLIQTTQGQTVFRSSRFKQSLKNKEGTENHGNAEVEYIDLNSHQFFVCCTAISGEQIRWSNGEWENEKGQVRFEYPKHFYTETRDREVDEFQYIIEPLSAICEASVKTGNPIRWC